MNVSLVAKFFGVLFSISFAECKLEMFQHECINYCKSLHPRKTTQYLAGDPTDGVKYNSDDVALAACQQRCRMAEVIRPKKETEIFEI